MGIGERIRSWIETLITGWEPRVTKYMGKLGGSGTRGVVEGFNPELMTIIQKAISHVMDMKHSDSVRDMASGPGGLVQNITPQVPFSDQDMQDIDDAGIIASSAVWTLVGSPLGLLPYLGMMGEAGLGQKAQQSAARYFRPTKLAPRDCVTLFWRSPADEDLIRGDLERQGFGNKRIDRLFDIYRPLIDPEHVRQLVLRGEDPSGEIEAELKKAGYTPERIAALKKLWQVIPPIQELIRMAVREAFTPEIAEKFGQYQDFPPAVAEWAGKQGLSEEWAQRYWAAHWDLPSIMQGMEMLHRNVIDQPTMDLLLRALDVMPYWRDKLTAIAYNPLTRVDVRRMYGLNVLDRAGVKRSYLDLGYNEENAERMTEFTVRYESAQDKDLTKAEILKAYRKKTLSADDTMELLQELGYSEDDADFIMQTEDVSAAAAEKDLSETRIKQLYLTGIIPRLEATAALTGIGYDANEIEYLYKLWDLEWEIPTQQPTRAELTHFLEVGILTQAEFEDQMANIGYPAQHVAWYLEEFQADQVAAARKEELRAQTEASRVAAAAKTTKYERDRAGVDVNIAQAQVYIAEAQRSLLSIGTAAEQQTLRSLEARQRQALARLALDDRQLIARLSVGLRIASRGATDEEKAVLERAAIDDREAIETLSIGEREQVANLALEESEQVRAEVSDRRTELQVGIAGARADIAALQLQKAQLKLSYVG